MEETLILRQVKELRLVITKIPPMQMAVLCEEMVDPVVAAKADLTRGHHGIYRKAYSMAHFLHFLMWALWRQPLSARFTVCGG